MLACHLEHHQNQCDNFAVHLSSANCFRRVPESSTKSQIQKFVQTITYVPYFISIVVLIGMVNLFLSPTSGIVNAVVTMFGGDPVAFMQEPQYFLPIYIITAIWQNTGWSAIIYIAALTSVPPNYMRQLSWMALPKCGASGLSTFLTSCLPL